jgi:NAD(P)-dependent dehydrogenase (short-subunit alcohol dehydrogenase family)
MSKTILITGTSSGFGKDAAKTLAQAGHRVFATMRDVGGRSHEAAAELRAAGLEVLELDVTSDASVQAALQALYKKTGDSLDVLVNNAGALIGGMSETWSADQVRNMFEVNVIGVHRLTRAVLPKMRQKRSGLIVNIGSILGRVTLPFFGLYGATKHAVEAMTESYRYELSQLGVDVVLVQPGPYPTQLYAGTAQPADGSRAAEYGEIAALPAAFVKTLQGIFAGATPPDPHDVAKTLVELVATPAGKRPNRVVVGLPFGADGVNTAVRTFQSQLISSIGFDQLAALKV